MSMNCGAGEPKLIGLNPSIVAASLFACLVVNFLDLASTAAGLLITPDIQEQNLFARVFLIHYGIVVGIIMVSLVKLGIPLILYLLLRERRPWYRGAFFLGLCINTAAVLFAVANNCGVFFVLHGN